MKDSSISTPQWKFISSDGPEVSCRPIQHNVPLIYQCSVIVFRIYGSVHASAVFTQKVHVRPTELESNSVVRPHTCTGL